MAERRYAQFFEVVICEFGEQIVFDIILSERLRVLAEAKSFEPLRDIVSHGASLRQAGFAEAVKQDVEMALVAERHSRREIGDRHAGRE